MKKLFLLAMVTVIMALVSCSDEPFMLNGNGLSQASGNLAMQIFEPAVESKGISIGGAQVTQATIAVVPPSGPVQTAVWHPGGPSTFYFTAAVNGLYTISVTELDTSNTTTASTAQANFQSGYNYYITITLGGNIIINVGTNGIIPPSTNTNQPPVTNTNTNTGTTFGLYSETVPVDVVWDTDGVMDVWNAGFDLMDDTTTFGDGTMSLKLTCLASSSTPAWAGFAMRTEPLNTFKNLSSFTGGYLKFMYRSTKLPTKIGIKGGTAVSGERWITGTRLMSYGLTTNNVWNMVTVPLAAFTNTSGVGLNLTNITQYFMFVTDGANHVIGNIYNLDNIYFQK